MYLGNFLMSIFTTSGADDAKVIGTIQAGLLIPFIWHLWKSNQTKSCGDINS